MEKLREMIREREGTIVLPRIENTLNILLLMCDSKTLSEISMLVKVEDDVINASLDGKDL